MRTPPSCCGFDTVTAAERGPGATDVTAGAPGTIGSDATEADGPDVRPQPTLFSAATVQVYASAPATHAIVIGDVKPWCERTP